MSLRVAISIAVLLIAAPARAIVVADGDARNQQPPDAPAGSPVFPYWDYLARRGSYSAVYLGDRWVLTAGHIGLGGVEIRGRVYAALPDSEIDLRTGYRSADLSLFRLREDPELPPLPLSTTRAVVGEEALLLGFGRGAGEALRWRGKLGRYWDRGPPTLRWGRNRVSRASLRIGSRGGYYTETFAYRFDPGPGAVSEAQAAQGDSGGATFLRRRHGWELAGILFLIQNHVDQPGNSAVAGNLTFAADLAVYLDQIQAITGLGLR